MSFPYPPPPPTTCVRCGQALVGPYAATPAGPMHYPCSAAAYPPPAPPQKRVPSGCVIAALVAGGVLLLIILILVVVVKGQPQKQVSATCRELVDVYDTNEVAAEQRFDGKVVRLNACRVAGVERALGSVTVELVPAGGSLTRLRCGLRDEKKAAGLSQGDPVEVTGRVLGKTLGSISIADCAVR